jgi:hypothetical protein
MSGRDPHLHEIIDYLQPFIDGKVSRQCDLVRWGEFVAGNRHSGHAWCHDNAFPCACPCHWTEDQIAFKLIEVIATYEPAPIVRTWLAAYMGRQTREAKRLRSLAVGRDKMVERVIDALAQPAT